jgi:chemotaxis protein MotB
MWNNLSRFLFVFGLIACGVAAYLYWGYGQELRQNIQDLEEKQQELALENNRLKEHVGKARATQAEMVKTLQKEVELGQIKITQLADRLSLNIVDKILFPSGKDEITEEGKRVLKRVGDVLFQVKDKTFRIEGHTDNVPTGKALQSKFPSNWELSTARATNVVRFLQESAGIDPATLEAVGMGEYHPIASNKTPQGRGQNRRIEIILFPRVGALVKELPGGAKSEARKKPAAAAATPGKTR